MILLQAMQDCLAFFGNLHVIISYAREAWCICTRFACTGMGRRPDAPYFCPAFLKAGEMFPKGNGFTFFLFLQKEPKSMLPRQGHAFHALESSRKGTGLFFSLLRKEPKVAQRVATLWTPRDGSKLYWLCFFVTFPALVPKPVYGAARFFGCFEPVRKGYCSADARSLLFKNGML